MSTNYGGWGRVDAQGYRPLGFYLLVFVTFTLLLRKLAPGYGQVFVFLEILVIFLFLLIFIFKERVFPFISKLCIFGFLGYLILGFVSYFLRGGVSSGVIIQSILNAKLILLLIFVVSYGAENIIRRRFINVVLMLNMSCVAFEIVFPGLYYSIFPGTSEASVIPGTSIHRFSGAFIHPGQMAFFLIGYIFLCVLKKVQEEVPFGFLFYSSVVMLMLSGQRVEILFFPVLIALYFLLTIKGSALGVYLIVGVALFFAIFSVLFPVVIDSFSVFFDASLFDKEVAPRSLIFRESLYLAGHFFPFGSGFATFGSAQSLSDPKAVYDLTYLPGLWWFDNGMYLFDFFWGSVIGESGYIGLTSYVMFLIGLFLFVFRKMKSSGSSKALISVMVLFYIYFVINTLGTPFLNGSIMMQLIFLLILFAFAIPSIKEKNFESS